MTDSIEAALRTAVKSTTKDWAKAAKKRRRGERAGARERQASKRRGPSARSAAFRVMPDAYRKASGNGRYPANARQIMYAARPAIIKLTGKMHPWKHSSYFTQVLLPEYMEEHPHICSDWDVVFDARGKLMEPHAARRDEDGRVDMGTLQVRRYVANWHNDVAEMALPRLPTWVSTSGPDNRYKFALFIEKEGFEPLLDAARIADRYDLAIMSTKGMSTTAARQLVEELSGNDVTILAARDFDKAGFSIVHTLTHDTRRYIFFEEPNVIDIGLRLEDVQEMGLESEDVTYRSNISPRWNLKESGATQAEMDFLVSGGHAGYWHGQRVELNAMTSDQFIEWVERKLEQAGVEKVVPDDEALARAYRRALRMAEIQRAIDKIVKRPLKNIDVPDELQEQVETMLTKEPEQAWDDAVFKLAQEQNGDRNHV